MPYNFDKIASTYDHLNHVMTMGLDRRWRKRAVKGLHGNVLDVACGTGDMVVELSRRGCKVTGVDISEEMLAIARHKTAGWQPTYQLADAENLPFDDNSFDAVTCAFGIRNFRHLEQGLTEMIRVLRPGGKLVILELSTPDCKLLRPLYNLYTRHLIPWLGEKISGNREAYTYLPQSIEQFPKGKEMLQIFEKLSHPAKEKKIFFGVCRMYTSIQ